MCTFHHGEWESRCLWCLTDSDFYVIAAVSSLILNKNSQRLLLSQAPSRLQSRRICEHKENEQIRATDFTFQTLKTNMSLKVSGLSNWVKKKSSQAGTVRRERAQERAKPSFTPKCWLHWIWGHGWPCCIVGQSNTFARLRGPQVNGGHVTWVKPPGSHMTKLKNIYISKMEQLWNCAAEDHS